MDVHIGRALHLSSLTARMFGADCVSPVGNTRYSNWIFRSESEMEIDVAGLVGHTVPSAKALATKQCTTRFKVFRLDYLYTLSGFANSLLPTYPLKSTI